MFPLTYNVPTVIERFSLYTWRAQLSNVSAYRHGAYCYRMSVPMESQLPYMKLKKMVTGL